MAKKVKLSVGKKEELRKKLMQFRLEGEEGNKFTFFRMTENERFKIGRQWDHDDVSFSEANGKFSLTINEILPIVLDMAGTQEENPLDYKVRNVKGGTQTVADVLSALAKNVMDKSMGREEASRAFESGVTTARGFLGWDIDFTNDPLNGDFVLKELDPFMVLPDPTCKEYDYNKEKGGAKYIWVDEWEDKEKIEAQNPDKKQEIKEATFDLTKHTLFGRFSGIMGKMFGGVGPNLHLKDDYRHHDEHTFIEEMGNNTTKQTNNHRVSTCWWKEWKKGIYVQKLDSPLTYLALTDPKDISDAKKITAKDDNIKIIEKDRDGNQLTVPVLNKTRMIGDVILEHIEDPFDGMNLYPVNRFAPYFDHGYEYPPVENLKGPQKLINFTFSSVVNMLKGLSNTGWITGQTTQRKKQELEETGNQDGIVLDITNYGNKLEKIKPNDFPLGLDIITERGKQNMREISQVQLEVPAKRAESGRALAIREQQSAKTKGIIFRNWNQTNILNARVLIELIRNTNVFSNDEILAIVDEEDLLDGEIMDQARGIVLSVIQQQGKEILSPPQQPNPIRMATAPPVQQAEALDLFLKDSQIYQRFVEKVEQKAIPIAKELILRLVKDMQQGRYGTKVDTSPMAPTLRIAQRLESLALDEQLIRGGRPGISRKKLIEISDIPDKEEIAAEEVPVTQKQRIPARQGAA